MSNYQHAVIKVHYRDKVYESLPLDLTIKENSEIIYTLSTYGTNESSVLKIPTSETSEMIFSKFQLDESLIEISLVGKKRKQTKKIESVES
jgi:hypothetical protein